jgi:hypothetical protein
MNHERCVDILECSRFNQLDFPAAAFFRWCTKETNATGDFGDLESVSNC